MLVRVCVFVGGGGGGCGVCGVIGLYENGRVIILDNDTNKNIKTKSIIFSLQTWHFSKQLSISSEIFPGVHHLENKRLKNVQLGT